MFDVATIYYCYYIKRQWWTNAIFLMSFMFNWHNVWSKLLRWMEVDFNLQIEGGKTIITPFLFQFLAFLINTFWFSQFKIKCEILFIIYGVFVCVCLFPHINKIFLERNLILLYIFWLCMQMFFQQMSLCWFMMLLLQ